MWCPIMWLCVAASIPLANAFTPPEVWRATLGKEMRSDPALAHGMLYIGNDDGGVYAIEQAGGTIRWRYECGGAVYAGPRLTRDARTLYIGSLNGSLVALQTSDGHELWRLPTGGPVGSTCTLSGDESTLYFGTYDQKLCAVHTSDGAPVWCTKLGGNVGSESVLTPDGQLLLVGARFLRLTLSAPVSF